MAQKTGMANPIANFYEAQTAATAEIAHAALNGLQRLQKLTLEAMRAGAGGQLSLAQSMATMRDGGNAGRSAAQAAVPAAEQSARYQREMVQAIADMNNDIVRASYSMMERMRDAVGAAQGVDGRAIGAAGSAGSANERRRHDESDGDVRLGDAAMADGRAADDGDSGGGDGGGVGAKNDQPLRPARAAPSRKPKRAAKRKAGTHPR